LLLAEALFFSPAETMPSSPLIKPASPKAAVAASPKAVPPGSPKAAKSPKSPAAAAPAVASAEPPAKKAKAESSAKPEVKSAFVARDDNLTYDLHHMAAYDIAPLPPADQLFHHTRDSVQLLLNKIYSMPQIKSEEGQKIKVPEAALFVLPRIRPIPVAQPKTRWEKFMEARGMEKQKRSRLVWDESSGDWKPRWGYKSGKESDDPEKIGIYEFKKDEDHMADPFERIRAEKKLAKMRHKLREVRNQVEGQGGSMKAATPDLRGANNPKKVNTGRGVDGLREVIKRAQDSSGSRFKFDRVAPNEATNLRTKKKKLHGGNGEEERDRYMKFAGQVLSGQQYDKEKMAKVGAADTAPKKKSKGPKGTKGDPGSGRRSKQGGRNAGARKKGRKVKQ